jgi:putative aldouronate transport system permease protein
MPLSKPALATIALFNGVYQWNDFMTAKLYMTDTTLYPVQMKLYEIIVQQQAASMNTIGNVALQTTSKGIQLATIVVTTVPILIIYPLLQKHFVSGMMLGAVKE